MGSFVPNILELKLVEPMGELLHVIWDPFTKAAKHEKVNEARAVLGDDSDSQGDDNDEEDEKDEEECGEGEGDFGKYDPEGMREEHEEEKEEGCEGDGGIDDAPMELEGAGDASSGTSVRDLAERIDIDLEAGGEEAAAGSGPPVGSSSSSSSRSSSSSSSDEGDEGDEEAIGDAEPEGGGGCGLETRAKQRATSSV